MGEALGRVCDSRFELIVQALLIFVLLDICFGVLGFPRVYRHVRRWSRATTLAESTARRRVVEGVREAVRNATRYYWRRRLDCLPRSLTVYLLLQRRGVPATLHIGVKRYPFGAHAWVECDGDVVDDSANTWRQEPYLPIVSLVRCTRVRQDGEG